MKKKILIITDAMEIGGVERALLGLLNSFDYEKYSVDLFLSRHSGELFKLIPNEVNLLPEIAEYSCLAIPFVNVLKKHCFGVAIGRFIGKQKAKSFNKKNNYKNSAVGIEYSHKFTNSFMPNISNEEYDVAISFMTPHYFVQNKVKAKKKLAWIHTDYSYVDIDVNSELKMWSAYDNIISISEAVTTAFLKKFPSLEDKIVLIENISSKDFIDTQSNEVDVSAEMPSDCDVNLLSVGRFSYAKNFDNVPEICSKIREKGINAKWYLIGYGGEESLIRSKIKEFNVEDFVIVLGKKDNPYPYIKVCDIYVQPSRYEGKAVTVSEALILNKPVVITNYSTAESQLTNGVDGIIVPLETEACANEIAKIIQNKELRNTLISNTKKHDYTNSQEIEKLYNLIG